MKHDKDKRLNRLILISSVLVLAALVTGFAGGLLLKAAFFTDSSTVVRVPQNAEEEFELLVEVWQTIDEKYVNQEELQADQMAYGAAHGLVGTLKDAGHSRFLSPEMVEQHRSQIQGQFEGIGAYVEMRNGRIVIVSPIDNTPAQRAGLKPGDVIQKVNGQEVTGLMLEQVISRIKGPAGTEVTLTILDPDSGNTKQVTLERAEIDLDLVAWEQIPGTEIAYLRISAMSDGAGKDLRKTLQEINDAGMAGILLDLRNNPGGLLGEAVAVSSQLIDSGTVLVRVDARGETTSVNVNEGAEAVDLPVVALANQGTASGAEIVIGALQDHDRAQVVGTTTSGAGTVLNSFSLPDGAALLIAVEEWLTPDGRVIWQQGLAPDREVVLPEDVQPLIKLTFQDFTEESIRASGDQQFLTALEMVVEIVNEDR